MIPVSSFSSSQQTSPASCILVLYRTTQSGSKNLSVDHAIEEFKVDMNATHSFPRRSI